MVSRKVTILALLFSLIVIGILGFGSGRIRQAYAADPPLDHACRDCHGDSEEEITLPSGETLSLQVPLEALNNSPHSANNVDTPVICLDCHRPRMQYQYPHQPQSVESRQDFRLAVTDRCQSCHYPHNPLHSGEQIREQANSELPVCVDCHGSHQIDYSDDILNSMPAACIECHTGRTVEWAADFIAPRAGWGEAAEGYVGSDRCGGCHEEKYFSWRETLHAKMIQNPATNPEANVGDFNRIDPDRTFELDEVLYTIGSRWKQRYLTQDENGDFYILPAQWNVEDAEWIAYKPDTWQDQDNEWRQSCGSCHVTGLDTQNWGFAEFGVGCESCHGPGAEHVSDPENTKPFSEVDDQVCGSCHSRGTSPDGFDFPATYRPGDNLSDHFTFTTAEDDVWPDGSAKKHRQQYMDWQLGSSMEMSVDTNCITCHSVHDSGSGQTQLKAPLNELCLKCHTDKKAIIEHVPFHDKASAKHKFVCADCHMPKMVTHASTYDIRNHSFTQPKPQASLDHGGLDIMLNACNTCHTDLGEDPQWAIETIAYANSLATPGSETIFGPGPTPTSPPPPTPLPSVGQAPEEVILVETGRWLRYTVFILLSVIVAAGLYWGVTSWLVPSKKGGA